MAGQALPRAGPQSQTRLCTRLPREAAARSAPPVHVPVCTMGTTAVPTSGAPWENPADTAPEVLGMMLLMLAVTPSIPVYPAPTPCNRCERMRKVKEK